MDLVSNLSNVFWIIAALMIFGSGIYFTFKLHFVQFNFFRMFYSLNKNHSKKNAITPKQALMMVLAGRVGVGSISGVALAIYTGGVGAIFWMWISALASATNCFGETVLGIKYKEKDEGNIYRGGPSYYIKKGLKKPKLAFIYAILILICYIGGFLSIQANTIAKSSTELFNINSLTIAMVLSFIIFFIIFGGIKKISKVTDKLVPAMILLYILTGLLILVMNFKAIPSILLTIVQSAFNSKALAGGFLGTFLVGIQRGIFSNEAGMGTGAIASSTVETNNAAEQGYVQMLGVYITTMLICTATAIIILTSDYNTLKLLDINGIEITQYAFKYHLGDVGNFIVFISIILFAFSTILTGYYYSESCLKSIKKNTNKIDTFLLKLGIIGVIFLGCLTSSSLLWGIVDLLCACLVIINIYALLKLRNEIKRENDNYKM